MKTKTQVACAFTLVGISIAFYVGFIVWELNCHG